MTAEDYPIPALERAGIAGQPDGFGVNQSDACIFRLFEYSGV